MKYEYHPGSTDAESRKMLDEKVLYLINSGIAAQAGSTGEDIYNAYTGDGGLHGLAWKDYDSYHNYSEAKAVSKAAIGMNPCRRHFAC